MGFDGVQKTSDGFYFTEGTVKRTQDYESYWMTKGLKDVV